MPITDFLTRNARMYPEDVALVEVNPEIRERRGKTWREYDLVETNPTHRYRRELNWKVFNDRANRFAHLLLDAGVKRDTKVAILMMNCLEWLPVYMGVLKSGAIAVPLNYRYTAEEIKYCLDLADVEVLVFGPEFIGRIEEIADQIPRVRNLYFVGEDCPTFADSYNIRVGHFTAEEPAIDITDDDLAAIYFSSGTTGFPKAILHKHRSLMRAASPSRNITAKPTRTTSCASRRCTTWVPRCTGWEGSPWAPRPSSCAACGPTGSCARRPRSSAPSCGCSCRGPRTSWTPSRTAPSIWTTTSWTSGGSCTSARSRCRRA
jgi:acyl-CoA synthetase (AMP-forming)/AMP-acid ligase II